MTTGFWPPFQMSEFADSTAEMIQTSVFHVENWKDYGNLKGFAVRPLILDQDESNTKSSVTELFMDCGRNINHNLFARLFRRWVSISGGDQFLASDEAGRFGRWDLKATEEHLRKICIDSGEYGDPALNVSYVLSLNPNDGKKSTVVTIAKYPKRLVSTLDYLLAKGGYSDVPNYWSASSHVHRTPFAKAQHDLVPILVEYLISLDKSIFGLIATEEWVPDLAKDYLIPYCALDHNFICWNVAKAGGDKKQTTSNFQPLLFLKQALSFLGLDIERRRPRKRKRPRPNDIESLGSLKIGSILKNLATATCLYNVLHIEAFRNLDTHIRHMLRKVRTFKEDSIDSIVVEDPDECIVMEESGLISQEILYEE